MPRPTPPPKPTTTLNPEKRATPAVELGNRFLGTIQSPKKFSEYRPVVAGLKDIYQHTANVPRGTALPDSLKKNIRSTLVKVGYSPKEASDLVNHDKELPIKDIKKIVSHLHEKRVSGFDKSPNSLVNRYVRKEQVRRSNIDRLKRERVIEDRSKPLNTDGLNDHFSAPRPTQPIVPRKSL